MSIRIIDNLINKFCERVKVDRDDADIQSIKVENNCAYLIELKLKNYLYVIRHYEHKTILPNVNYGDGYWHDYLIYDDESGTFTRIDMEVYHGDVACPLSKILTNIKSDKK